MRSPIHSICGWFLDFVSTSHPGKKEPGSNCLEPGIYLATTYSHRTYRPTTIGAAAFHFRVRNGTGWFHRALVTRGQSCLIRTGTLGNISGVNMIRRMLSIFPNSPTASDAVVTIRTCPLPGIHMEIFHSLTDSKASHEPYTTLDIRIQK